MRFEITQSESGNFHTLYNAQGGWGISLDFDEVCHIRRLLASIFRGESALPTTLDDAGTLIPLDVYIETEGWDDESIEFGVGHVYWFMTHDEARQLLESLDETL